MSDKDSNKKASEREIRRDSTTFITHQEESLEFIELYGMATTDPPPPPKKEKEDKKDK